MKMKTIHILGIDNANAKYIENVMVSHHMMVNIHGII